MGQMRTDLSGANLAGANLSHADLNRSLMTFADLKGADLRGANLYRVKLSGADLTGANIAAADFTEAKQGGSIWRKRTALQWPKEIDRGRHAANRGDCWSERAEEHTSLLQPPQPEVCRQLPVC